MAELQARLDALNPANSQSPGGIIELNMPGSFSQALHSELNGGFSPMNPFSQGNTLAPDSTIKSMIQKAADDNGVQAALLEAVVEAESGYDPKARSHAGAMGLTQLMPSTAASLGVSNPFDPQQNLNGGAKYLAGLINRFDDLPKAIAAYNAGPGRVERGGPLPLETTRYVRKVMDLYNARKSG
jgi:soluble lytic murein transglycosylase-like protein